MPLFHISPKTGKSARCRATKRCRYGQTTGTTTTRDGTTITGTAGEHVEFIGGNPTVRPTTRKPYGPRKKKVDENSTTEDPHEKLVNNMTGGYSARGNLEGDSIEEFARKAAVPRLEAEKLHEMKKKEVEKENLRKEEERKAEEKRIEDAIRRKKAAEKRKAERKKMSPRQRRKEKKRREKARWQKLTRMEKMREIMGWKEQKKRNTNSSNSNSTRKPQKKNTMFDNIEGWVKDQKKRGKSTDDALNALLGGKF